MKIHSIWIIFFLFVQPHNNFAQSPISVSKPQLELLSNELIITYDILNSDIKDLFVVWLEITDESGNVIQANTLSGDIGEKINGGINKKIVWNLEQDEILIDKEVFFEIFAERVNPPVIQEDQEKLGKKEDQEEVNSRETTPAEMKSLSRSNMVFSSIALPGWGQSKKTPGKPYWIMGVAGYGCLSGSVILNRAGVNTYRDYLTSMDADESNSLYDKSVRQDNISEYLAYAAAGIWGANIIWTLVTPVTSRELTDFERLNNFNIQPVYNKQFDCTMVSITYTF